MIALVTTYFLVFYILIPGVIFRFASSLFVRLKLFQRTRTQEATFAVSVALLPFALALAGVWYAPVLRHYPFAVPEGTFAERRLDYRRVTAILTSADASRQLTSNPAPDFVAVNKANWTSLNRVLRRQARFLTWYFVAIALEGVFFGLLASRYGDWQVANHRGWRRTFFRIYAWGARKFFLPNISEWHMLLTTFNLAEKASFFVAADILQNDANLYKGRVADYFIDPDGKLTGILLQDVYRFERQEYEAAKLLQPTLRPFPSDSYWQAIPSANFYIPQSSVSNLNLRYAPRANETLRSLTGKVLKEENILADDVSISSQEDGSGDPRSSLPDVYS